MKERQMKIMIESKVTKDQVLMLKASGVPEGVIYSKLRYDLVSSVMPIAAKIPGCKTRKVPAQTQIETYKKLIDEPFLGNPLIVISSWPSENKATVLAYKLIHNAVMQFYKSSQVRHGTGRSRRPMWHRLVGGFYNQYSDPFKDIEPNFLVLSNITEHCTAVKWEKMRDLLAMYDHVPRIVATCGVDPLTFAHQMLGMSPSGVIYLQPNDASKVQEL